MSFLKKWGKYMLIVFVLCSFLYAVMANPRIRNNNIIEKEYKMCEDYTKEYCNVIDTNLKDSGVDSKQCKMCVEEWKPAKETKKEKEPCGAGYTRDMFTGKCKAQSMKPVGGRRRR